MSVYASVHVEQHDKYQAVMQGPSLLVISLGGMDIYISATRTPELFAEWCELFKLGVFDETIGVLQDD